jgi:Cu/Ag efflux protein CusF
MSKFFEKAIMSFEKIKDVIEEVSKLKKEFKQQADDIMSLSKSIISLAKTLEIHHESIKNLALGQQTLVVAVNDMITSSKSSTTSIDLKNPKTKIEKPN